MVVGEIKGNLKRLAIVIQRRACAVDGMVVWVNGGGAICCAHTRSDQAKKIYDDAAGLIVGTYAMGSRALDIFEDLDQRAQELACNSAT